MTGVVIYMQNTTIFKPVFLEGSYTIVTYTTEISHLTMKFSEHQTHS